ncbi:MAG TPA: GNAT family N-acetyltransferase [Anaerolineae bacterium]|nr:GNAT family N-acetyltransferase [Anaerolineae bacterium]
MVDEFSLREATPADIPALVSHRRRMFEDMDAARGITYDPRALEAMDTAYAGQLRILLPEGRLRAWVIEADGQVVASGAILVPDWLPRPADPAGRLAYLHSVYTLPQYRRRGLARRIVQAAIDTCRVAGMRRLTLHASQSGRSLYESLGFLPTNEMRLVLS